MFFINCVLASLAIVIYFVTLAMYAVASGPKLSDRINDAMVRITSILDRR